MTREEKIKLAIEKGITYNPETGDVVGVRGKVITGKHSEGYITIGLRYDKKGYDLLAHQFAWYVIYGEIVEHIDHINGIRNDNRICNLRSVTKQENAFNRTTSKGYHWHKRANKWHSQIKVNDKRIHLGYFNTEEDAREAYLAAKEQYHII
jgi:hypothetical protein